MPPPNVDESSSLGVNRCMHATHCSVFRSLHAAGPREDPEYSSDNELGAMKSYSGFVVSGDKIIFSSTLFLRSSKSEHEVY